MKKLLLELLQLIVGLARIPKKDTESAEKQKKKIELKRDEISTFHGDHEVADPEITDVIDDLIEIAATSEPDEDYAEVPEDIDEEVEESDDVEGESADAKAASKAKAGAEDEDEEPADEDDGEEAEDEEEPEPPKPAKKAPVKPAKKHKGK